MSSLIFEDIQLKIESLALKVFTKAGMELIDINVGGHKNDVLIQITADKPSGGITIRECAILNKSLVAAIELEGFLPPECFSLELSSPGLDRPLVTRKDFMRFKSKEIHLWFNEAVSGKKEAQGILSEVGDLNLTISIPGNHKLVIPLSSISKGMLVI